MLDRSENIAIIKITIMIIDNRCEVKRMRYSRQREMILSEMKSRYDHPTADMLYADLRQREPSLSLATVYRNLNQLADNGNLRRMHTTDGKTRFDGTLSPHEHMHCEACGKVVDCPPEFCRISQSKILEHTGFSVSAYELFMTGVCPECAQKTV